MDNNQEEEDMQKWEYSVGYWYHINGYTWGGKNIEKSSEMLNHAGNQGWERVSTGLFIATNFSDIFMDYIYLILKGLNQATKRLFHLLG